MKLILIFFSSLWGAAGLADPQMAKEGELLLQLCEQAHAHGNVLDRIAESTPRFANYDLLDGVVIAVEERGRNNDQPPQLPIRLSERLSKIESQLKLKNPQSPEGAVESVLQSMSDSEIRSAEAQLENPAVTKAISFTQQVAASDIWFLYKIYLAQLISNPEMELKSKHRFVRLRGFQEVLKHKGVPAEIEGQFLFEILGNDMFHLSNPNFSTTLQQMEKIDPRFVLNIVNYTITKAVDPAASRQFLATWTASISKVDDATKIPELKSIVLDKDLLKELDTALLKVQNNSRRTCELHDAPKCLCTDWVGHNPSLFGCK